MKYVMDLHAKIMQMRTKDIELARNGLCRVQLIFCKDNANENKGHRACSKWSHLIIRAYDLT